MSRAKSDKFTTVFATFRLFWHQPEFPSVQEQIKTYKHDHTPFGSITNKIPYTVWQTRSSSFDEIFLFWQDLLLLTRSFHFIERLAMRRTTVRETGISQHHEDPIEGTPKTPITTLPYSTERFKWCPRYAERRDTLGKPINLCGSRTKETFPSQRGSIVAARKAFRQSWFKNMTKMYDIFHMHNLSRGAKTWP